MTIHNSIGSEKLEIEWLFNSNYFQLIAIAYKYTRCKEISKDIVGDVFLKLVQLKLEKNNQILDEIKSNPPAYLTAMVKNKCLDHLKSKKIKTNIESNLTFELINITENLANKTILNENFLYITSKLEPKEKIILFEHLEGYKNEEIAQKYSITYNTVKNKIYEAKKKLKKILLFL